MKCTKCGSLDIKVRETKHRKAEQTKGFRNKSDTPYVYRRRVCLSCGHKFSTNIPMIHYNKMKIFLFIILEFKTRNFIFYYINWNIKC